MKIKGKDVYLTILRLIWQVPLMETKLALHSLATAFARSVLPQPGGP